MRTLLLWKFVHIASMFAAASIFVGQGLLSTAIARRGDVPAIRRTLAAEARFGPIGGGLFFLGIAAGVATALTGDFDLTAGWLLLAYAITAVILATGIAYHGPRGRRLQAAADASPEDHPSEELRALIEAPSARFVSAIDLALWLAVIYVMVAKPLS